MERLSLPSWFPPAPSHPGEVKWGKFKAAEWKSFCTVNLPITLTRLWGSLPVTDRHYLMLQNFLQLVAAIKLANGRTITIDQIVQYEQHMRSYLTGLVDLYPWISITPYQHMALHFPQYFTLPHLFRSDSGKSGGIRWNSGGIPPYSGGLGISFQKVRWNTVEFRFHSGFIPVSFLFSAKKKSGKSGKSGNSC